MEIGANDARTEKGHEPPAESLSAGYTDRDLKNGGNDQRAIWVASRTLK